MLTYVVFSQALFRMQNLSGIPNQIELAKLVGRMVSVWFCTFEQHTDPLLLIPVVPSTSATPEILQPEVISNSEGALRRNTVNFRV